MAEVVSGRVKGQVVQDEVSGVRTFWVESGRPTLSASLVFRHGMADETLATSGWLHLLEHLALHDRARGGLSVNGSVSLLTTQFDAQGSPEEVAGFFAELVRWLGDPTFGELDRERSVLRAEAALRGPNEVGAALLGRYGATGPGLSGYHEPGLSRATAGELSALAARVFTQGNCALVLDGAPPAGLRLDLPPGAVQTVPVAHPTGETLPAAYLIRSGIVLSGVVQRSPAATVLPQVLRAAFTDEFRHSDGAAYAPWAYYEPVDADHAVVLAGTDANDVLLRSIVDRSLAQLHAISRGRFRVQHVRDAVAQTVQATTDPYRLPALAMRSAVEHLRGREPQPLEEILDELHAVNTAEVAHVADTMRSGLLLGIQGKARWSQDLPMQSMPTTPGRTAGRAHRSRNFPAYRHRLVVGDDAVQLGSDLGHLTIRRVDVAGLFVFRDGARAVVDRAGWSIAVEPTMWVAGETAVRCVDAMVPEDLHIPMLDRDEDAVPQPASWWARARYLARSLWSRGGRPPVPRE